MASFENSFEKPGIKNIAKGGPRFHIPHVLRLIATTLQAHMAAVRPEMTHNVRAHALRSDQ